MYSDRGKATSRVLIADDDPIIRHWLTAILEGEGYIVVSTNDGRDAYRLLQGDANFSGAVFDLSMPYLKGPDLIRYMRTEKRLMRIPVMLITAEQDIAQVAIGFAAGATVLLPKPFTRERLQSILRMMLGRQPVASRTSLPTAARTPPPDAARKLLENEFSLVESLTEVEISDPSSLPAQPVDLTVLGSLEDDSDDGDSSLIIELIDLYRVNGTRQVDEIKAAAAKMDEDSLKYSAHALKGSSWTMGANSVAELCERLETPQVGSDRIAELTGNLETAFASAVEVFGAERARRLVPAFA